MTPFHDKYESPYVIKFIKEMTKGSTMLCNSYTAQKQWGWGEVITHGMDPNDWFDLPKEPRCVTVLSPAGMEKAYRRIFLTTTINLLKEMGVPFSWVGVDIKFDNFKDYAEYLGRSLVFFMPTWQSPRPRARTEAMFSGCCIVSTPYQDADTFIKDGVNGFLTSRATMTDPRVMDNPEATAKLIKRLVIDEPELALRIGQEGKKTANELFAFPQFEAQWSKLLTKLGVL
jgi:glycosyltransferase involved in cell wall biosynthesis